MGDILYALRECINEFRCAVLSLSARINTLCFRAIYKLDRHPGVRAAKERDRGA
jgi:hypothetical protein